MVVVERRGEQSGRTDPCAERRTGDISFCAPQSAFAKDTDGSQNST